MICGVADGQENVPPGGQMKTMQISRIDSAPVIDGMLDEVVWSQITPVADMHQVEPIEYAEPTQATQIYLYYDDEALYLGVRMLDSEA